MNAAELLAALELPAGARVERRVPKTLLLDHGAATAADRRCISEGIEELRWVAALKPTTIGLPAFRDEAREYLEIAVLQGTLRERARAARLVELIHRAVPYPVVLATGLGDVLTLSLAHKRWSLGQAGRTVLDGPVIAAQLGPDSDATLLRPFRAALSLACQPPGNLYTLYQGWIDTVTALLAVRVTGAFAAAASTDHAALCRDALAECARLEAQMARLRAAAAREKQVPRRVEMNLELKRLQAAHAAARARLVEGKKP